jgi:Tannase and feruloyl esterase/3HB-oligomer hydrolase (3HBOH)
MTTMALHLRQVLAAVLGGVLAVPPFASPAGATARTDVAGLHVPGAERQVVTELSDLTTAGTLGTARTDQADWAGLHAPGTVNPSGVPGVQIDGYFPDTSTSNTNHGWNHDAQFVIRLPRRWNGGLVVAGSPGVREQYANDFIISDWVLARGYAFASTDKGNTGAAFFRDGARPGDAIAEWHFRVTQLTVASKVVVAQRYGHLPRRTIMTGISNGGYLTRWQLERVPWLYDGGVDWEGTLFTAEGPHLLTFLPPALRAYPRYAAGGPDAAAAHAEMLAAGYPPGSEPTWKYHYDVYWDLTQRIYREEFDPGYDGDREAGTPFCAPGSVPGCDADYDYASRPERVRAAVRSVSLTGRIGKPMLTVHGTLDALLPISLDSDRYAAMVRAAGRGDRFRYYRVEGGVHTDGTLPLFPGLVRPILPCYRAAFQALEGWLAGGTAPPPDATVARPTGGDPVNTCSLT